MVYDPEVIYGLHSSSRSININHVLVHELALFATAMSGMQIHIRPVARGDKNYVRAIVNQHVTSPAGD